MAGFKVSVPGLGKGGGGSNSGGARFQRSVRPPTQFPHLKVSRRDYSKPELGAEQPLGMSEGQKSSQGSFGNTGLTGES
jgi:hypothetical protein